MTHLDKPSALKHGAFSDILILPGEDPTKFEELKNGLFIEYKPSGISEEMTLLSIAKAMWQERRLVLYKQIETAKFLGYEAPQKHPAAKWIGIAQEEGASSATGSPQLSTEASDIRTASRFGRLVTLDHLAKELDVELKIHAKIDRLFKRLFQQKAWKQIDVVTVNAPPRQIESPALRQLPPPPEPNQRGKSKYTTTSN